MIPKAFGKILLILLLEDSVWPCVYDLKMKHNCLLHQYNDLKHTSKFAFEWLKRNKMKTMEQAINVLN